MKALSCNITKAIRVSNVLGPCQFERLCISHEIILTNLLQAYNDLESD